MEDLKFDTEAMSSPKTKGDAASLLKEFILEAETLLEKLQALFDKPGG